MTCEEAKAIINQPLDAPSRAERQEALNHLDLCPDCVDWFWSPARPRHPAVKKSAIQLFMDDMSDPEVNTALLKHAEALYKILGNPDPKYDRLRESFEKHMNNSLKFMEEHHPESP